jgi:hypothetical protein
MFVTNRRNETREDWLHGVRPDIVWGTRERYQDVTRDAKGQTSSCLDWHKRYIGKFIVFSLALQTAELLYHTCNQSHTWAISRLSRIQHARAYTHTAHKHTQTHSHHHPYFFEHAGRPKGLLVWKNNCYLTACRVLLSQSKLYVVIDFQVLKDF